MRAVPSLLLLVLSGLLALAWWLPNRPQLADLPMPAARFNSVSFAPYRAHESPLTRTFPTQAEVDQDLGLIATRARAFRTYAAIEGNYDLPALARSHGLKMWQGIWLGTDRAANAREIAAGIAAARKYPDVIERVIVGNEVLLRKDLPPDELIAAIDQVKRAVHQPVTYADVWNFFEDYPQVVPHLDVVTIHILPYWEDDPTNIDTAIAHAHDVLTIMQARFPHSRFAVGETGWPSRGRWRRDAAPGLVNEVRYLRRFMALAVAEHIDYNFFQSFDENWKYRNEGVVGASWGLWTTDRTPKFPLIGAVREDARWPIPAALSIGCGFLLYGVATWRRGLAPRHRAMLALVAMALGGALGVAWQGTHGVLFDFFGRIAGTANLTGQAALALLFVQRSAGFYTTHQSARVGTGRDTTTAARALLHGRLPVSWSGAAGPDAACDDLCFAFAWTAAVLQLLLLYDPRYRDFPQPSFAVPILVSLARLLGRAIPRGGGGREEWVAGGALLLAAIAGAVREGPANSQSLTWAAGATLLALPLVWRLLPPRTAR